MDKEKIAIERLKADPEMRSTQSGKKVCSFTLAVNRPGKDAGTDWIDIVAWEKTAEFVCKYFTKGQQIALSGRIQTRSWEDNGGNKRKAVEVVAEEVHFAEAKKDGQGKSQNTGGQMGGFIPYEEPDEKLPWED